MEDILHIESLRTHFFKKEGLLKAVDGISLTVRRGETLALVGESGSGKSVTALSVMRLIPPPGRIVSGRIDYIGQNLMGLTEKQMTSIRGREIALILQDPATALNPVISVGKQVAEVLRAHHQIGRSDARQQAYNLMERVQIPNARRTFDEYPHQLSGGLKQRMLIAVALACRPSLLIADEPTTALDVSIQSQILALLKDLKAEFELSMLLITHDLSVVAEMADRVAVMYAGKIVETAPAEDLFSQPVHPYTGALLQAIPRIDFRAGAAEPIRPLSGSIPDPMHLPDGCTFLPRCPIGDVSCTRAFPEAVEIAEGRLVACFKASPAHSAD